MARVSAARMFACETRTGAAFIVFVVNVPAATAGTVEKRNAISGLDAFVALMPAKILPAVKDCEAVTPPGISVKLFMWDC